MPSVERGEPGTSLAYHVDVEVLSHTYMYLEMESVAVHFSLHRLVGVLHTFRTSSAVHTISTDRTAHLNAAAKELCLLL